MKVFKDGKEIKVKQVQYMHGLPTKVMLPGAKSWYPAGDFTFSDEKPEVKTKNSLDKGKHKA